MVESSSERHGRKSRDRRGQKEAGLGNVIIPAARVATWVDTVRLTASKRCWLGLESRASLE